MEGEQRSERWCSQDKTPPPTLFIQACLNTETLSDRVAVLGGDAVFITSVSRSADKLQL